MESEDRNKDLETELKCFFLGPQAENGDWIKEEIQSILNHWIQWRQSLFPGDGQAIPISERKTNEFKARKKRFSETIRELESRLENETPKFTPRYIGHMVSEVSLPAIFGHLMTLLHNPNNATSEVSKVGSQLESEAIQFLLVQKAQAFIWGAF